MEQSVPEEEDELQYRNDESIYSHVSGVHYTSEITTMRLHWLPFDPFMKENHFPAGINNNIMVAVFFFSLGLNLSVGLLSPLPPSGEQTHIHSIFYERHKIHIPVK